MSVVNVGVIGAGSISDFHLDAYRQHPDARLAAICDLNADRAREKALKYGIPHVYTDYRELLNNPEIDAVSICTWNNTHAEISIAALRAGKHVLVEKPLCRTVEEALEIERAVRETGNILQVGFVRRYDDNARMIKAFLQSGEFGEIYYAKASCIRRNGNPGGWFADIERSGGGPLIDIGVHMLDLTLYLMGSPKPVSVYGTTYAEFGPRRRGLGDWGTPDWNGYYDVEDLATALIKLDNGATLSLEVSWAANAAGLTDKPFVHLLGTEAGIGIVGGRGVVVRQTDGEVVEEELKPLDGEDERILLSRHFIECVREGREPIAPALSGYVNNRILSAIYESSRTGGEVKLSWD